jgi:hypothetical protein
MDGAISREGEGQMTMENPMAVGSTTTAPRVGQHLLLQPKTLVFSIDDTGDERMNNRQHPVFAFGGVSCVAELHSDIARKWRTMKSKCFP